MTIKFPLENTVVQRYSVRNYQDQTITDETREAIEAFIKTLDNPFGQKVNFHYLDQEDMEGKKALGTYGVIKGAKQYIGATIQSVPLALEALGYEFEALILYLAHLGIGTCWLGGTFNRDEFAQAMKIGEDEMFPIITPYGYATSKKHVQEKLMRKLISADKRKEWSDLFYLNDFNSSLAKERLET